MYNKRIFLLSIYKSFKKSDKYLFDYFISDGFTVIKYLYFLESREPYFLKYFRTKLRLLYNCLYLSIHAKKHDVILVWDYQYATIRIGFFFRLFRPNLKVIGYNSMEDFRNLRIGSFRWRIYCLAYQQIICTMSSQEQIDVYRNILRLPSWHFHLLHDSLKFHPRVLDRIIDRSDKGYIFVGGGTGRDWNMVKQVAKMLPEYSFKIATNKFNMKYLNNISKNVSLYIFNLQDFSQCEANSSLCFTPLTTKWQGGVTAINDASYLGKMTITTKTLGITGYYHSDEIVLISKGNYKEAVYQIKKYMSNKALRDNMALNAQKRASGFTFQLFYKKLKDIFNLL